MQFYRLVIGILVVWRLTHLLVSEAGPWEILERMRRAIAGTYLNDLVNCFYCLSVWVSVPFAFILDDTWKGRILLWPALSAGAIIVERVLYPETFLSPPIYHEDPEEPHVLRQEQDREPIQRS